MWLRSLLRFLFFVSIQSLIPTICRSLHSHRFNAPSLRTTTSSPTWPHGKYFSSSFSSSNAVDQLQDVQQKMSSIEYCLDNFGNITVPTDADLTFARLIRRYDSADKGTLFSLLKDLQGKKTILLARQLPVKSEGRRMNVVK